MSTRYFVRLKHRATGQEYDKSFATMTERNLFIFTSAPIAIVVKEWTASEDDEQKGAA